MASLDSPPEVKPEAEARATARGRGRAIASWLAGAFSVLGFGGMVMAFREKIRTGHGGEIYRTGHGYQVSYLGAMVLIALVPVVMIVGSAIGWWQRRDEREFDRRYPPTRTSDDRRPPHS
jgi:hypothetical protein